MHCFTRCNLLTCHVGTFKLAQVGLGTFHAQSHSPVSTQYRVQVNLTEKLRVNQVEEQTPQATTGKETK